MIKIAGDTLLQPTSSETEARRLTYIQSQLDLHRESLSKKKVNISLHIYLIQKQVVEEFQL